MGRSHDKKRMKHNLRIPENLKIILETEENNQGLIVQFNPNLWAIFGKNPENPKEYGYQLMNPNTDQRGSGVWGLTHAQCDRLINKLIKNPGYGFGKSERELEEKISKLINKIKKTYV